MLCLTYSSTELVLFRIRKNPDLLYYIPLLYLDKRCDLREILRRTIDRRLGNCHRPEKSKIINDKTISIIIIQYSESWFLTINNCITDILSVIISINIIFRMFHVGYKKYLNNKSTVLCYNIQSVLNLPYQKNEILLEMKSLYKVIYCTFCNVYLLLYIKNTYLIPCENDVLNVLIILKNLMYHRDPAVIFC